jgi:hypothetical protein
VSKHYEVHTTHTMQTITHLKQKTQTTCEPTLSNTNTCGGMEPLKLAKFNQKWFSKWTQVRINLQL